LQKQETGNRRAGRPEASGTSRHVRPGTCRGLFGRCSDASLGSLANAPANLYLERGHPMRSCLQPALAVFFPLVAAASPGGDDPKKSDPKAAEQELRQLQGTWKQVSIESDGQKTGFAKGMSPRFTIQGDEYTVMVDGRVLERGRIKVYPGMRPRQADLIFSNGAPPTRTFPGIYEINGDELRTCFTRSGGPRPSTFPAVVGSGESIAVY
jgi:uncharacterized protein (TIGR03067 family)